MIAKAYILIQKVYNKVLCHSDALFRSFLQVNHKNQYLQQHFISSFIESLDYRNMMDFNQVVLCFRAKNIDSGASLIKL